MLLDLPPERAAERLPATLAELAPEGDGTLLRMRVSSLDWMAGVLAGLGCAFTIRRPDELRASVAGACAPACSNPHRAISPPVSHLDAALRIREISKSSLYSDQGGPIFMARHRRRIAAVLVLVGASTALALLLAHASSTRGRLRRQGRRTRVWRTRAVARAAARNGRSRGRGGRRGVHRPRVSRRRRSRPPRSRARSRRTRSSRRRARSPISKWDSDRARHAQRRPARHAVLHQADAVVRPRDRGDRRAEVRTTATARSTSAPPAAASGARRTRSRRSRTGSRSRRTSRRTRSARSPSTRTTRRARRSTSAPARGTPAATARPASASTSRPTRATTGASSPARSPPRTTARSTWVAIEPGNANHILIGTRSGTRGEASNSTSVAAVGTPTLPTLGVYASTDGGATFSLVLPGTVNEVKFDPSDSSTVYATLAGSATGGLLRSTRGRRGRHVDADLPGEPRPLHVLAGGAAERQDAHLPRRRERRRPGRAGLPHRRREPAGGDADCASNNATRWTRLSNPTDGTPGFAVYNYCDSPLSARSARYDMSIMSPPDRPDMVVVARAHALRGAGAVRVPGRARSSARARTAARCSCRWTPARRGTDMTGDVGGESMHPDQHAIAFVPGDPDKFFVGSDGGLIRTSGKWADASSQCDDRGLDADQPRVRHGVQAVAEQDPERAPGRERRARRRCRCTASRSARSSRQRRDDRPAGQRHGHVHGLEDAGTCRSRATAATAGSTPPIRTSASTRTRTGRWTSTTTTSTRTRGSGSATASSSTSRRRTASAHRPSPIRCGRRRSSSARRASGGRRTAAATARSWRRTAT